MTIILMILRQSNFQNIITVMQLVHFPSPFEEAIILTLDGGEWANTTLAIEKISLI